MPNPLRDPPFRRDIVNGLLGLGNDVSRGAVTGLLGAPVDIATMTMRPFGYSTKKPVMGSEWLDDRMVQAGIYQPQNNSLKQQAAMLAGGLINPGGAPVVSAKAAALAKGLLNSPDVLLGLGIIKDIPALSLGKKHGYKTMGLGSPAENVDEMHDLIDEQDDYIDALMRASADANVLQQKGIVRTLEGPDGQLYVWPASMALHQDLEDYLKLPRNSRAHGTVYREHLPPRGSK